MCDKDCFNFGEVQNPDSDSRIFQVFLHHSEMVPKTICSTISQKVMDGFTENLVDRLGVLLGRIDSILVNFGALEATLRLP